MTCLISLVFEKLIRNQYFQILISIAIFSILLKYEVFLFLLPFFSILIGIRHKNKLTILYTIFFLFFLKTDFFFTSLFAVTGLNYEPFALNSKFLTGLFLINHIILLKSNPNIKKIELIIESIKISNILIPIQKKKKQGKPIHFKIIKLISAGLILKLFFAESFYYWSEYAFEGFSMNFVQVWVSIICNSFYYLSEILSFLFLSIGICNSFGYNVNLNDIIHKLEKIMLSKKILNFSFYIFLLLLIILDNNYLFIIISLNLIIISKLTISYKRKKSITNIILFSFSFLILPITLRVNNSFEFFKVLKEIINIKTVFVYYNELYILWPLKINWLTFLTISISSAIIYNYKKITLLLNHNKLISYLSVGISIATSLILFSHSIDFTFI